MPVKTLSILLASPRGFCAGVDRAVRTVELALAKYGAPVYVRHEIVHNAHVVRTLQKSGAVFVEELDEVPSDGQPVIFSAHGVPQSVPRTADARHLTYIDATCPLVGKVHAQVIRAHQAGRKVILIGHAGHPEVIGTMGQLPEEVVFLVQNVADVETLPPLTTPLTYCTQTTLSVADTHTIIEALQTRFPTIEAPIKGDICYATTNRQMAIAAIAPRCTRVVVIGAANSSNACRLVEVARSAGCADVCLIAGAEDMDWASLENGAVLGLTAGASAPEILVQEVLREAAKHFRVEVEEVVLAQEDVHFKLPSLLA